MLISIIVITLGFLTFLFLNLPAFGKLPGQSRLERIVISPNYKNGSFKNLQETRLVAKGVSYFSMFTKYFATGIDRVPLENIPAIKTDLKSLSPAPQLIWFGHSSYFISINNIKILVDPVFSERPSPVQFAGSKSFPGTMIYKAEDFPELDLIIITHDHYDHLDHGSIKKLKDKVKRFYAPLGVGEHLSRWGVEPNKIKEFDWWESETVIPGVEIFATPARHFSGRGFRGNKTLWTSYVLKINEYNIFVGGDSGYDGSFKSIGEKFGPFDIAILECGQYDVQWPDIHMMPEETVQASLDLGAKILLPVHWGKFKLGLHPWKDPIQRASKHAESLGVKMITPQIGEPFIFGEKLPMTKWWDQNK